MGTGTIQDQNPQTKNSWHFPTLGAAAASWVRWVKEKEQVVIFSVMGMQRPQVGRGGKVCTEALPGSDLGRKRENREKRRERCGVGAGASL